ncbi:hypothetical protein [Clostridium folliculivorans]|uniref:Tetratricopeptide repeat protein n=1 Tax=Clostridium folliculivorans TaxID=2886038 RepID=A0A9W6DBX4_9CLOT|nr:hypothetical protein [Clostridium folliculivorans]GKU26387.1 hypothetical protein CFOLD11_32140 [Clostridium folliculivorans]GKU32058.1 hypothetical protein CFB3_41660 [Clostridium folliculivorans]
MRFKLYDSKIDEILIENDDLSYLVDNEEESLSFYVSLGDELKSKGKIYHSYICFCKAYELEATCDDNLKAKIAICLSTLALKLNKICEAKKILTETLDIDLNICSSKKGKLLLNYILALKVEGNLDDALENILLFESNFDINDFNSFSLITLKANILKEKGLLDNAVSIHKLLFASSDKIENKLVASCNMLDIYMECGNLTKIKELLDKHDDIVLEYINLDNKSYETEIYFTLFKSYDFINDQDKVIKFYKLTYDSAVCHNDYKTIDKCINSTYYSNVRSE